MDEPDYPREVRERIMSRRGRLHTFETLDPERTALLVVDLQVFFMKPERTSKPGAARGIVENVNRLARAVRRTGGHVVYVISTYGPDPADDWPVFFNHVLAPDHANRFRAGLGAGSEGHALWPEIEREDGDSIVSKNRFGAFSGSNGKLDALLRGRAIDTVLVAGTVTTVCCETTAREAVMHDFKTVMVWDANAGWRAEADLNCFATFLRSFGDVRNTESIIALLEAGAHDAVQTEAAQ